MTLPDRMQALVVRHDGYSARPEGPGIRDLSDWVSLEDIPVPRPTGNQVLVRVGHANVNPSDLHYIKGEYGQPRRQGVPAGFEAMGEVVEAASEAGRELIGKRVALSVSREGSGAWADYALTEAAAVVAIADGLRDEDGAALIVNPMTAYAMVRLVKEQGSPGFVMTAGASQLGKLMASLARDEGLAAIGVVRHEEQRSLLEGLGASMVLNSARDDFPAMLSQAMKEVRPTVLLDAVADGVSAAIFKAMPRKSRWIVYGKLSSDSPTLPDLGQMVFMGKIIEGFWLTEWMRSVSPEARRQAFDAVQARFIDGRWSTDVAAVLSLAEAPRHLAEALAGMNRGKVLIRP